MRRNNVALHGLFAAALALLGCPGVEDADGDGWAADYDCDDNDAAVHPEADEACDGVDTDCDGSLGSDEVDADEDGSWICDGDCDDNDDAVFPGATEICDGKDSDCNDVVPDDELDADGDGYMACDGDCDDADPNALPGGSEAEACADGADNDCDGLTDELDDEDCGDADGDGYTEAEGDCNDDDDTIFAGAPELCDGLDNDCDEVVPDDELDHDGDGMTDCEGDCDDTDPATYDSAAELCDGVDNDCDGAVPTDETDDDGDGFNECADEDCDDSDPNTYPGATEICDGLDNDCDGSPGEEEVDADGDGHRVCGGDCDDGDPAVYSGAAEVCDGLDNDCDGAVPADETDDDGDGVSECSGDCDDTEGASFPGNLEICDGLDNDCDAGTDESLDSDGDGYSACGGDCDDTDPGLNLTDGDGDGFDTCGADGIAETGDEDCDDTNYDANPGADERCDGADNDCDEIIDEDDAVDVVTWYRDWDEDGFGNNAVTDEDCDQPAGYVEDGTDCDDADGNSYPGAEEVCDEVDNDCDGLFPLDEFDDDGDGWSECEGDCDDTDADLNLADVDGDGYDTCAADCDDTDGAYHPGIWEDDGDGIDWNCDGVDAVSLSTAHTFIHFSAASALSGDPVCDAGDVDGDGLNDVLLGIPRAVGSQGVTYLMLGSWLATGGTLQAESSHANFHGESSNDQAGISVSAAGDVDGDGLGDFLIGAEGNADGGSEAGKTYLVLGVTAQPGGSFDLGAADAAFVGESSGDHAGVSVCGGDFDGDSFSDVVIGANLNDDAGDRAGKTYLFAGANIAGGDYSLASADVVFTGQNAGDQSGYAVACVGDVSGDGLEDLLIAATSSDEGGTDAGKTFLIFSEQLTGNATVPLSDASAAFIGEDDYDYSGFSISSGGDVDGDGLDDVLIGSPVNDEAGLTAGKTYLFFGSSLSGGGDFDLATADISFLGEAEEDWSGGSISGGGDVDGDGLGDILIGAHSNDAQGAAAGMAYLLLGASLVGGGVFDLSAADVAFPGENAGDTAGNAVAIVGDVNGDGLDDLVIGAPGNDAVVEQGGRTYLLLSPY